MHRCMMCETTYPASWPCSNVPTHLLRYASAMYQRISDASAMHQRFCASTHLRICETTDLRIYVSWPLRICATIHTINRYINQSIHRCIYELSHQASSAHAVVGVKHHVRTAPSARSIRAQEDMVRGGCAWGCGSGCARVYIVCVAHVA
jgi:hypothetical protein